MTTPTARSALSRRRLIQGALVAGVAAPAVLRVRSAYAAYPERPVKIVVANTPGGPSDIVARIVAAALQEQTGKTFIVENRGGAGGNIGFAFAAHSEPDGYTILQTQSRSEEHTSELQSHSDLVCRLLLEKKKKKQKHPSQNKKKKNKTIQKE